MSTHVPVSAASIDSRQPSFNGAPTPLFIRAKRTATRLFRFGAGLLFVALAALFPTAEAVPPTSFAVENVITEIEQPITLRFLPDGRMLLLQKKGIIRIVNVSTIPAQSAVYLNLADAAHAHGINYEQERGLLDIAIDPAFPSQPYIYLFYTPASGGTRARIARFTHVENSGGTTSRGNPGSEVVLWQDTNGYDSCCHYGGGLDFGPDGKLWLTTGDHFQGSYATDLTKSGGGVVRINKDGTVPADNPWNDGAGPNHDALFAKGLRNPFRARWDFPTGRLMIAEVGGNEQAIAWEDLHVLRYDSATSRFVDQDYGTANDNGVFDGLRFGWPTVEGMPPHTDFPGADIQPIAEPVFGYRHNGVTAAINGGIVYRGTQFPSHYVGAYFYADSTRDFVRYVKFNANGTLAPNPNPDPISEQNPDQLSYAFDLAPQGRITCLDVGPDGALYYVSFTDAGGAYGQPNPSVLGAVRRYVYDGGNARPDITTFTGTPATGAAPLNVQFSIQATDPEGDAMTYIVDFGDGSAPTAVQPLPGNTTVNVAHTFPNDGAYVVNVYVSDASHTSSAYFEIKVGTPPAITSLTVTNSRAGSTNNYFRYGDVMTFAATATDAQDGTLGGASMEWSISFVRPGNTHPSFGPQSGMTSLDFPIPAQGQGFSGPVYYRCFVTVTDSSGLSTSASIDIFPEKSNITFNTVPSGIPLQVDGNTAKLTPFVLDTLINYQHTITVPANRCVNGTQYDFVNWSNGPTTVQQTYLVPATDSSLTANYSAAGPCAGPPTTGLVLHLDSEAGVVADGTTVAAWDDQSPQGHTLLAAGAPTLLLNAVNGRDAIHLDGVDDALLSTTFTGLPTVAGARTVFMVARYNAANNTTAGWAGFAYGTAANNRAFGLALTPAGTLGVQAWGSAYDFVSNPPTDGVGDWLSHSAVYAEGTITQYLNGTAIGSASRTYNTNTTGGIRIGEELNGGKNLNMDVVEILVYNRALTETERQQVNDYLDQRYALTLGGGQPPVVAITAPADGTTLSTSSMPVTLTGTATDNEDGDLGASLQWTSSIDGPLGTGASISATLSAGSHLITASATDSSTLAASDTINVLVSDGGSGPLITSGLVLQLESDLNVSTQTGTTVAGWLDQSGLGNDLVAGGAPQLVTPGTPTGLPAIRLDGVDDKLERIHATDPLGGLPAANANRTVFLVGRYTSSTAWAGLSYGTGANNQAFGLGIKHPNGELLLQGWGTGNDLVSTSIGKGSGWLVQSGLLEGGVATLFRDGAQIAQFNHTYNTVLTRLVVGQEIASLGYVGMDVAAVLIYNRALTPTERASVLGYLQQKYLHNSPPVVTITAPANNATFDAGATVNFTASATDEEQGNLSALISWTSDRDGNLGTGGTLSTSSLSSGTHVVSASVTDGSGLTDTASVTLTINGTVYSGGLPATSSLALHLEATQGVSTSGSTVTSWSDASARANHLTAVGNPQLLTNATPSGLPAISLDGVDDRLERTHANNPLTGLPTANVNRTIFLVGRYQSSTAWAGVSYGTGANNQAFGLGIKHPNGELFLQGWGTGNDLVSTSIGKGSGWLIQSGLLENGVATLFKDGTQIAQFTHNYNTVLARLVVGQEIKSLGYVGMDVAAILIYDRALTAPERADALAYLQQKYLTASSGANTAPVVDVTAPVDGASFSQGALVTFNGTATDAQQGSLSASLAWASDRDGSLGTGASVSRSNLSAGTHIVTASVTDGGGLSGVDSVSITVGQNASPTVSISAPAEGSVFSPGTPVTFTATALDAESGDLTAQIGWSSDRDGSLGTGGSITRSSLSSGTHVVTASATDGNGLTGVDSVAISVSGVAAITPQSLIRVFDGTSLNGLYPWFSTSPFADPNGVFTVQNGMLRVSGNGWGSLITQASYRDYVMILEFKWGPLTWDPRKYKARDAGILIHSHGAEGGWDGKLMPNHHVQIMEGSTGDLILLKGTDAQGNPLPLGLTAFVDQVSCSASNWNCRGGYRWNDAGNPRTISANLDTIHWTNWDAAWKDKKGYRGANDVERPVGEWNQLVVVASGDTLAVSLNGVKVNEAFALHPTEGKLQLESEYAEIYFRRWDLQPLGHTPPPMITKDTLPSGKRNNAYTQAVTAVSGVAPLIWSLKSGTLPTGLLLNPLTGQITGVPITAGSSTFTVQVSDSTGVTAAQAFTLSISS